MIPADRAMVFLLALLACLAVLGTVMLFLRVRHGTRASRAEENQQSTDTPPDGFAIHRQVIVEHCSPSIRPTASSCVHSWR